jgi:hypothetical protein
MRHHRLDRLARLTQGAALVGMGLFDVACNKEPVKPEEPHINSPPQPDPTPSNIGINATATPPPADTPDAGGAAPPPSMRHTINATARPVSTASGATPPSFRPPAQLNAPTKSSSSP